MEHSNYTEVNNSSKLCLNNSMISDNILFVPSISILLVIVMFVGVIGNLLVIYVVLNYGKLKTVTNTYLFHLALSDLVFLSGIPFFISSLITRAWIFGEWFCKLFFLTQGVNQYTSIIILALLSFDRYLAVCYSAKSIHWRTHVNPNFLLLLSWLCSFILMLPIIIYTTSQTDSSSKGQCTITLPFSQSRVFYHVFIGYTSTITFIIPICFMTYCYIRIVARLRYRVLQNHRRSRIGARNRRKVSILVLTVISIHFFCGAPYWTFQIIATSELLPQESEILLPISIITQVLLFVNSSTNPIIYAFLSEVFRMSFKRVFYCSLTTKSTSCLHDKNGNRNSFHLTPMTKGNQTLKKQKTHLPLVSLENTLRRSTVTNQEPMQSVKSHQSVQIEREDRRKTMPSSISILISDTSAISDA